MQVYNAAQTRMAICPTCQRHGEFQLIGTQKWPEAVAAKLGLPTVVALYQCEHCHTTISEHTLLNPAAAS